MSTIPHLQIIAQQGMQRGELVKSIAAAEKNTWWCTGPNRAL